MRIKIRRAGDSWAWTCPACVGFKRSRSYSSHRGAMDGAGAHMAADHPPRTLQRYRCTVVGCNPQLWGEVDAETHASVNGHRIAKWPKRSAEGERRARQRNRSGYYDRYNVGHKARGGYGSRDDYGDDSHPFSPEALGQD